MLPRGWARSNRVSTALLLLLVVGMRRPKSLSVRFLRRFSNRSVFYSDDGDDALPKRVFALTSSCHPL